MFMSIGRNRGGLALSISDHMCQRVGGGLFLDERVWGGVSSFQTNDEYFLRNAVSKGEFSQLIRVQMRQKRIKIA
jgi:hypothetical protein